MSFIRYFIATPRIILKDNRYSSTDKLVFGIINSLSNMKGYCYASNSMLATELNVGTKTISNSISKLKNNKHIIVEYVNSQRRIYLNPQIVKQENAKVKEKYFQQDMENNFQDKRINKYKRKINNKVSPIISIDTDGVELWNGKRCESTLCSEEEQKQLEEMLKEFKD